MTKNEKIQRLYSFRHGLGEFQVKQGRKTLNGMLNAAGEIVLEPQPHTLYILDENTVALYYNSGNKYKVLDLKSNNIYTSEHYWAQIYGGAKTWQRGKGYGVIDINGNIMIPHKYRRLWRRADASYIACNRRNKYGLLDSCGNELIPFEYDDLRGEMPDRISARQGEDWFVLDGAGQRLSEKRYDYLGDFTENGYAIFGEKCTDCRPESMRYGIIDRYEKVTVQAIYSSLCWDIGDQHRLSCQAPYYSGFGIIDRNGNTLVPLIYYERPSCGPDRTYIADLPYVKYEKGDSSYMGYKVTGVIDEAGYVVIPFRDWQIIACGDVFRIYNSQLKHCGLYSSSGEELLPFEFDYIDNFGDTLDYIAVCKKREWYYVNQHGERVLL